MSCSCGKTKEKSKELLYQKFPEKGVLKDNMNLEKKEIALILKSDNPNWILAYTIDSVRTINNKMFQIGCGPNFEGDLISLCTCKHQMRTYLTDIDNWEGNWIAAFCSRKGKENALFYLMKIEKTYDSHFSFWKELNSVQRKHKSNNRSIFGDVYQPFSENNIMNSKQKHDEKYYLSNNKNHKHEFNDRIMDIEVKYWERYPALLRGEVKNSFIWKKPLIKSTYREMSKFRQKYFNVNDFINQLSKIDS